MVEQIHAARSNPKLSKGFGIKYAGYNFPEFPGVPWLALDSTARRSFLDRASQPVRYGPDYGLMIDPEAINEITERLKLQYEEFRDSDWDENFDPPVGFMHQDYMRGAWVVINLGWYKTDRELKADFVKLLKRRPKELRKKPTGRNNHRDLLNGLTGKRLIEFCRANKIPNPPEATLKMWRGSGCPYGDTRALRASIRRTKLFIAKEFQVGG